MPKVTLKVVNPYQATSEGQMKFVCNNPIDCVVHQELISAVVPYFDTRTLTYIPGVNYVYFKDILNPLVIKQPYSQLVALMNENAYHPVAVGSGETVDSGGGGPQDDGGNTGSGNTGTSAFKGSNSTTFNGACVAATNNDYKHNGSATLPVAGNKVFLNDGTTLLNDGYYGIASTGSTAESMIRVIAGFVASGYPLQCEELDQIYE